MARILGIRSQWVNKQSLDFRYDNDGCFAVLYMSQEGKKDKTAPLQAFSVFETL